MKELEALLIDLLQDKNKRLFLIGGAALAVLLIAVILITLLGGSGRKFNKYYNEAEKAYLTGDYTTAEEKLRRAMELKSNEKAYLLMADIYCAEGEPDRAIQLLYLGYSHVGGTRIEKRLDELKSGHGMPSVTPLPQANVEIAGKTMDGGITSLVLTGTRLKQDDLTSIASLTRMESLGLSDCGISDIRFLTGLTDLTFLQISDNSVRDLSPVNGMKKLKTLYIDNNPITDLSPLYSLDALRTLSMKGIDISRDQLDALRKALPNCSVYADEPEDEVREIQIGGKRFKSDVTELNLGGLNLKDISVLSGCRKLEKLDLRDNKIEDISPLVELPNLKWLCIWNNEVEDINPLLSLGALEYLDADENRISDISVLEDLPQLKEVWLNGNPLKSVEPLVVLKDLTKLGLADTDLEDNDLEYLMGLVTLEELNIKGNKSLSAGKFETLQDALPKCEIAHDELRYAVKFGDEEFYSDAAEIVADARDAVDLRGLEKFTDLEILRLSGSRISDLSPLRGLTKLQELCLPGSSVSDLSALSGLRQLKHLDLQNSKVSDLTPLVGCAGLKELDLSGNSITNLSPLAYMTALTTLDLSDNLVKDLSALYSLAKLKTLDLRGNPLKADDILALQTALPGCTLLHDVELPEDDPAPTPKPVPTTAPTPSPEPSPAPPTPASGTDLY